MLSLFGSVARADAEADVLERAARDAIRVF